MNKLGEKSLKTLEYYTVLELLQKHAVTQKGKEKCLALRPDADPEESILWMQQTTDAKEMMQVHSAPSFSGVKNVLGAVSRSEIGGMLNLRELLQIAALLHASRMAQGYIAEMEQKNTLSPMFSMLTGNRVLEEDITTAIVSEEVVADGASPTLLSIRREMRRTASRVRETLNRLVSGERSKYLQDAIITQRNGRFVVPVKSEHRGEVPGMIHDTSASGATVFVEPAQVVEINNRIKLLEGQEEQEIERILTALSGSVAACAEAIRTDYDMLCSLDFIFARAKLSYDMNACTPIFKREGHGVKLDRARHPLLNPKEAVPINIAIGRDYDTLVITGPNTGGKTVSLKTLGLLSLMAASGLHIPASETSEVALFQNVYADIGDEQSIEQSLSTFSSHMKTIVSIADCCTTGDLVLFDELGAGTDPVEGAALAVSIIGYARQMGAFVAATTHYSELKTFALTTDGVENASCEFDVVSLRPTYRLLTGIPGKSNAFAIAGRLGLSPTIIERAKEQISTENARFEDVLTELEKERKRLEKYKEEADRLRRIAQSEKDKVVSLKDKTEDQADRLMQRARDQADSILKDARMTAETVFEELNALKRKNNEELADENLAAARAVLRGMITEKETQHRKQHKKRTIAQDEVQSLKVGDEVQLLNVSNIAATVLSAPDKDGNLQVQAGIMKMTVKQDEVRLVKETKQKTASKTYRAPAGGVKELRLQSVPSEVDVRGMCAEEAILEVDQFLSNAIMGGLPQVRIIHGKGTGVLRAAIQQHLKPNRKIKTVRNGAFGEGEMGVTVVEFK